MQKQYESFDERSMSDGTYLVGQPVDQQEELIRIDTGWFETEAGEKGDWEYVVGEIVASDLQQDLQLEQEGEGTISRDRAIENVLDADLAGNQTVVNRDQATAVIDYFVEQGALTQKQDGELVVLQDPTELTDKDSQFDSKEREYHILSWTAAIDTCIDYMQETLDAFESARERLEQSTEEVEKDDVSETEKQVARVGQELKNLGSGAEVPDPNDLSDQERERYETLKEDFAYYKSLYEVKQDQLVTAQQGIEKLRRNIYKLRSAKDVYEDKVSEMRKAAINEQVFPSEDIEVAQNMAGLITSLSNAENPAEKVKQIGDGQDLNDVVDETLGSVGGTVDEVEETLTQTEEEAIEPEESELTLE